MRINNNDSYITTTAATTNDGGIGYRDAESIFRSQSIAEIRNVEATTQKQILDKQEELRQLVGNQYRDLIDSADSIVLMKSSCESISANISAIHTGISSLSSESSARSLASSGNPNRLRIYGIACRVKYLVDTPENIWGCLDEFMFLEAAARYLRAKHVHRILGYSSDNVVDGVTDSKIMSNFPLLQHQWQIVESFKTQISQRSRERLLDQRLEINAYADALATVAVIDELDPVQVLGLFLDSRKSWISSKLANLTANPSLTSVVSLFCDVMRIIQVSLGQIGMCFLQVLNDMPLFYKVILSSPPASQLFGGIPNPDEEVRLWKLFRDRLESVMVILDRDFIAKTCSDWLRGCGEQIVGKVNGKYLIDAIDSGEELASAEKLIRETMDNKEVLEGCLEWLKSVFGSEVELPWSRIRELVLRNDADLWDEIFEETFVRRTKVIIDSGFGELTNLVNIKESICAIGNTQSDRIDFQGYLRKSYMGGGVWFTETNSKKTAPITSIKTHSEENYFRSCLDAYFGPGASRIRDVVDSRCQSILEDLLRFLDSPKAPLRLKDLAPYLQNRCYGSMSTILSELKNELEYLYTSLKSDSKTGESLQPSIIVNRSLFIGRLLFALQSHSRHIPVILGSPRLWVNESVIVASDKLPSMVRHSKVIIDSPKGDSPERKMFSSSRRQTSIAESALLGADDSASPKLQEFSKVTRELCIKAHSLWISWVSDDLSDILSRDLSQDEGLSATTPLRGWEETVVKQDKSNDSQSDMKISLPSMPSLYVTSFLFRACAEIHQVGGHVLDKIILQKFALKLLERVISIYGDFLSTTDTPESQVTEKGVLQLLLDIQFVVDVLSGGDATVNEDTQRSPMTRFHFRRKQDKNQMKSVTRDRTSWLVHRLSKRLDPIDWLTYEPYLWENERQSYLRHAVLFGFFVQLNRMYTDTVQKLPTSSDSNIMRCSTVPRFKYLPISAPELSSNGVTKASLSVSSDDISSRSSWKAYTNGELSPKIDFDENSSFRVATPFLKSFMQVGSRFGESTMKLGSMLTDGQVGLFKDKSAAAMSTFGEILPVQAAGLLSSFTATRSDS